MATWYDPRVSLGPSRIEGTGMFANAEIAEGELIARLGGELLTTAQFEARVVGLAAEREADEADRFRYNALQIGEDLHLFDDSPDFAQGSVNHSCDSNLWMTGTTTISARRAIADGEELTLDYALFTTDPTWSLPRCRCGSPACRGTVRGSDWQLPEVQAQYAGGFSPFLNDRIAQTARDLPLPAGEDQGEGEC